MFGLKLPKVMTNTFIALLVLSTAVAAAAASEGTIRIAIRTDVPTLDPQKQGGGMPYILYSVYEGLARTSSLEMKVIPVLADFENVNPTTWKFTLKKGITFQNGEPLTAEDVQYSLFRQIGKIDPNFQAQAGYQYRKVIADVQTPDEYTVLVITHEPEVTLPVLIRQGAIYIVPKDYVEKVGFDEFAKKPNGSGPFKLKEHRISEFIALEANENYWNKNPMPGQFQTPQVKEVILPIIPQLQTAVAAFMAGEVDAVAGLSTDAAKNLEKRPDATIYYTVVSKPQYIMMNWYGCEKDKPGQENPFCDVRVRKAMNMAIDVPALIKNYGTGKEIRTTLVAKGAIGYNPDVPYYDYNPQKARELLKEAGYPNGFTTKLNVLADKPSYQDALAQYWRNIGVSIQYRVTTGAVAVREAYRKKLEGLVEWSAGTGVDSANGFFKAYVHSGSTIPLHAKDARIDALVDQQATEFDEAKRAETIHEIITTLWEEAWYIPLWEPVSMRALNTSKWTYDEQPNLSFFDMTRIKKK